MNDGWRTTFPAAAAVIAILSAAYLLQQSPPHYAAAAALLGGGLLISIILGGTQVLTSGRSRFSSHDYKNLIASMISLGGGIVVAFALIWILIRITGFGWTGNVSIKPVAETISLPLIVIVGVTVLLVVIALVTYTFSVLGLSSARDALGLPDGSVRAIIALMLLVLFSILAIFLYNSIAQRTDQTAVHVTQSDIDILRTHAILLEQPQPEGAAGNAAATATYTVKFREQSGPADDIAKQLIVMLGTLVTAVASFYFGSASVASASSVVLGQRSSVPVATGFSPNPITASDQAQTLTIGGSNLAGTAALHLEQRGQPDIPATVVKATENLLTVQLTVPGNCSGTWNVVVGDALRAITIGALEVASPETQPAAAPGSAGGTAPAAAGDQPPSSAGGQTPSLALDAVKLDAAMIVAPVATINKAFLGHGIFLEYEPIRTLRRYAGYKGADPTNATLAQMIERFVQAMQDMHIASVWVQLFTADGALDSGNSGTKELVAALRQANIGCAGWGYCYSRNSGTDAGLAKHLCGTYGIDAFVADVEPGNTVHGRPDTWQSGDFKALISGLKGTFGTNNLGISTFGDLDLHGDAAAVYKLAINDVAFFAPQIYWYQKAPIDYTETCIASFRKAGIGNPLIATTQSYWEVEKTGGVSRQTMEAKVAQFVTGFTDWSKIIGLNWYHGGNANTPDTGAMSDAMITSIRSAKLDQKAYATPNPADAAALSV